MTNEYMNDEAALNSFATTKNQTVIVIDQNFNILNAQDFNINQLLKQADNRIEFLNSPQNI